MGYDKSTDDQTSPKGPIVGIDLGTTNSAVAYFDAGEVRFFANALGETLTPSVVAFDQRAQLLAVGRTAKEIWVTSPGSAAASFKRTMGLEQRYRIGEHEMGSIELSAYVLDQLRSDAERGLGRSVERCVVTVPAYFNDTQRYATKQAAEMVGFRVERMLSEPTAAAIAYGLDKRESESRFLVFDLGGGTFDVCVMELFEGLLEVKSVAGESQLGGDDFTRALAGAMLVRAGVDPGRAAQLPGPFALLIKRCELLKRSLSRWPSADLELPAFPGLCGEARLSVSASEADDAYRPLLQRMAGPCRSALRSAEISAEQLDEVIVVGGATRLPAVRRFVLELFGREPLADVDPDLTVARGAAIQAALCGREESLGDVVVTDVCSHTLGISIAVPVGNSHVGGYFSPLIHRNTVLPTSASEIYCPIEPDDTEIEIRVFQGEARLVKHNTFIGDLELSGIPPASEGKDRGVKVTFTYDLDGILGVEAEILATGAVAQRIFTRHSTELSAEEAAELKARLWVLKRVAARPSLRQRPKYRDLLSRADALWSDLRGFDRERLTGALAAFEHVLDHEERAAAETAYASLLALCSELDGDARW